MIEADTKLAPRQDQTLVHERHLQRLSGKLTRGKWRFQGAAEADATAQAASGFDVLAQQTAEPDDGRHVERRRTQQRAIGRQ